MNTKPDSNIRGVDYDALDNLASRGLVIVKNANEDSFHIARPCAVAGTVFPGFEDMTATIIDGVHLRCNAPIASMTRTIESEDWVVAISNPECPWHGPIYFSETFSSFSKAASALIDCFFGSRIDFDNELLIRYGPADSGTRETQVAEQRFEALLSCERIADQECKNVQCSCLRIIHSVFCPAHHYEMIYGKAPPAT